MRDKASELMRSKAGRDFPRPVLGSAWAGAATVRLLWARHHHFAGGEALFSPEVAVYSLWFLKQGRAEISYEDCGWIVEAGQGFLGRPCVNRRIVAPAGAEWLSAGIQVMAPGGLDLLSGLDAGPFDLQDAEGSELSGLLELLVQVSDWPGDGGLLARDGLAKALAGWILKRRGGDGQFSGLPDWMRGCLERIEKEPGIAVDELARQAHFSPAQFRRLFARHLGIPPRDFLHQRRLELARKLVEAGDESMETVASRSGFGGSVQLSREFKRHFGLAPLAWRKASRERL